MGRIKNHDTSPRSRDKACPSFSIKRSLFETEGAGKTGRRLAPMVRVQQKSTRQNHRLSRNRPAFPAQWFYGLYALSPVTGLCCHRRPHRSSRCELSLSVGRPGPHDFAVRISAVRPHERSCASPSRPSHPASRFVTIAHTPLMPRRDGADDASDLGSRSR